jgi:hypothetical protein
MGEYAPIAFEEDRVPRHPHVKLEIGRGLA